MNETDNLIKNWQNALKAYNDTIDNLCDAVENGKVVYKMITRDNDKSEQYHLFYCVLTEKYAGAGMEHNYNLLTIKTDKTRMQLNRSNLENLDIMVRNAKSHKYNDEWINIDNLPTWIKYAMKIFKNTNIAIDYLERPVDYITDTTICKKSDEELYNQLKKYI